MAAAGARSRAFGLGGRVHMVAFQTMKGRAAAGAVEIAEVAAVVEKPKGDQQQQRHGDTKEERVTEIGGGHGRGSGTEKRKTRPAEAGRVLNVFNRTKRARRPDQASACSVAGASEAGASAATAFLADLRGRLVFL